MMVDPTVLLQGIEEDPSLLEELAALSGGGGGGGGEADDDAALKGTLVLLCFLWRVDSGGVARGVCV
jgi:hypothetical protein